MSTKDGWTRIAGYTVYVEDGRVRRGVKNDGQETSYPYIASKQGGWDLDQSMTPDAFRAKVRRGTAKMA